MKPITYTRSQLSLMLRVAIFFDPSFACDVLSAAQRRLILCGRMKPRPSLLKKLALTEVPGGYQWQPK